MFLVCFRNPFSSVTEKRMIDSHSEKFCCSHFSFLPKLKHSLALENMIYHLLLFVTLLTVQPLAVEADGWGSVGFPLLWSEDEEDSDDQFFASFFPTAFLRRRDSHPDLPSTLPKFEVVDTADIFEVSFPIDKMNPGDIEVELDRTESYLTIRGQASSSSVEGEDKDQSKYHYFSSSFSQTFSLDDSVDRQKISATIQDGMLSVHAPKDSNRIAKKNRVIPIITNGLEPSTPSANNEATSFIKTELR